MDLLDLNLDCWLLIADFLSHKDILNLAKVSSAYKSYIKINLLPPRFKSLHLEFDDKRDCINEEDFRILLDSIWPTVEFVLLTCLPENHFALLKLHCFPCVSEMRVRPARDLNDADIRALCGVFPNLRIYEPHDFFSSHTIVSFTHLENLSLAWCRNVTIDDIRHILLALNLKSLALCILEKVTPLNSEEQLKLCKLEEITLNCYELSWVSSYDACNPITFTNLKMLRVTGRPAENENMVNLFSNIKCIVPRDVYELQVNSVRNEFMRQFLLPEKYGFLNGIQKLNCSNIDIFMEVFGVPEKFKSLRELHFRWCDTTPEAAQEIASNSQKLDLLSFEDCQVPDIDKSCIEPLRERKLDLVFNWYPHKEKSPVIRPDEDADMEILSNSWFLEALDSINESLKDDRMKITFKWECNA